jgi:hypothetical protein
MNQGDMSRRARPLLRWVVVAIAILLVVYAVLLLFKAVVALVAGVVLIVAAIWLYRRFRSYG